MGRPFLLAPPLALLLVSCAAPPPAARVDPQTQQRQFQTLQRVQTLESELRQLRGEIERLEYRLRETESRGARNVYADPRFEPASPAGDAGYREDREYRGDDGLRPDAAPGAPTASFPGAAPELGPAPVGTVAVEGGAGVDNTAGAGAADSVVFNAALGQLREGRYDEAVREFGAFIDDYPDSRLQPDANYWLGEAHYTNRDWELAKRAYLNLGARYPNSAKLPDALLKLGYIYQQLGDDERARQMLAKLVEAFPDSAAARQLRTSAQ